ncbi:hypothetical protein M1116_01175 [Patescibacteria group bacterium]|nr:hypothetical protein [Patescibacteria group bacterium]
MNTKNYCYFALLFGSTLLLSACSPVAKKPITFSDDSTDTGEITPLVDASANAPVNITKTVSINQEFKVAYKTYDPDGIGNVQVKARSIKEIPNAGGRNAGDGKKLILVEIAVMGNAKNQGEPSTFNQIGDHPSPQFVMVDRGKNLSTSETTYFSDAFTGDKNLFELSKITLDHEQWVNTAIVFEVDKAYNPDLAFRFTNPEGKTEFYAIQPSTK